MYVSVHIKSYFLLCFRSFPYKPILAKELWTVYSETEKIEQKQPSLTKFPFRYVLTTSSENFLLLTPHSRENRRRRYPKMPHPRRKNIPSTPHPQGQKSSFQSCCIIKLAITTQLNFYSSRNCIKTSASKPYSGYRRRVTKIVVNSDFCPVCFEFVRWKPSVNGKDTRSWQGDSMPSQQDF